MKTGPAGEGSVEGEVEYRTYMHVKIMGGHGRFDLTHSRI